MDVTSESPSEKPAPTAAATGSATPKPAADETSVLTQPKAPAEPATAATAAPSPTQAATEATPAILGDTNESGAIQEDEDDEKSKMFLRLDEDEDDDDDIEDDIDETEVPAGWKAELTSLCVAKGLHQDAFSDEIWEDAYDEGDSPGQALERMEKAAKGFLGIA